MQTCPSCAAETIPDANFCGRCGAKLKLVAAAPVAACRCGAGPESIDAAGFCNECGVRQIDADPRDHEEHVVDADFGGVTDRGRRHATNEDAIAITERSSPSGPVRLLVVCDGVSTSSAAGQASAAAVGAFRDTALAALARGDDLADAAKKAANAAQRAVVAVPYPSDGVAPAATLMAALVRDRRAVLAWAGDSRAYLIGKTPSQITRDDSWYNDIVAKGALTPEQARNHKYAHAIVNSLGGLAEGDVFSPNFLDIALPANAQLLLCSDGLWNYADAPEALADLAPDTGAAVEVCRQLVAFANRQGGDDNISAVLLRLPAASPEARRGKM
jgi:serine/threonine protein phosphatase PrpC